MIPTTRRGFLKKSLGVGWTAATLLDQAVIRAMQANAQAPQWSASMFNIQKVADGVYFAVAKPQVFLNCNATIFERSKDLLVVDSHSKPSAVVALVGQIKREVTPKPVRYIVNSHFHWDHTQGSASYKLHSPNVDIIASEATRRLLDENGVKRAEESYAKMAESLAEYREKLAKATAAGEKAHWQRMIAESERYVAEMKNYRPDLPTVTFDKDLHLHDGKQDLVLSFRGRGHTAGDIVVYSPSRKAVATGDLCQPFGPYLADGYPSEWPATLRSLAQLDFEFLCGGHGPMLRGKKFPLGEADYVEELHAKVSQGRRDGWTLAQMQDRLTAAQFKTLAADGFGREMAQTLLHYMLQMPGVTLDSILDDTLRAHIEQTNIALSRG
jgi:cyclase